MLKIIARGKLPADYAEMMKTESHHDHEIVESNGVLRWRANASVSLLIDHCDLNEVVRHMQVNGLTKNSEEWRKLYRDMGYSLSGYWEIFYWDWNNDYASEYRQPEGSSDED